VNEGDEVRFFDGKFFQFLEFYSYQVGVGAASFLLVDAIIFMEWLKAVLCTVFVLCSCEAIRAKTKMDDVRKEN